ncbi:MAG: D-sedoheptulose-7-phosphate isomerase, partial [Chitinivibrionales bacterium]
NNHLLHRFMSDGGARAYRISQRTVLYLHTLNMDGFMQSRVEEFLEDLIQRLPQIDACRQSIIDSFDLIVDCYRQNGKLLVCGNGGSAADAEHIVGELMKEFMLKRRIPDEDKKKLMEKIPQSGDYIAAGLQLALPAISLVSQTSLLTAFANDVNTDMAFAQQVYGYGRRGDVLIAISTSGNSDNILNAARVAHAFGIRVIGLTGEAGGLLRPLCDVAICVPEKVTFLVQELHVPVYHTLCAMIEEEFFGHLTR